MHLILPDQSAPTRIILGDSHPIGDDEFFDFCMANPDLNIERTRLGEISIAPPVGGETDYRSADLAGQLGNWAKPNGRGKTFGSTACFLLSDGSGLSPDAAWVESSKLAALSKELVRSFCPSSLTSSSK